MPGSGKMPSTSRSPRPLIGCSSSAVIAAGNDWRCAYVTASCKACWGSSSIRRAIIFCRSWASSVPSASRRALADESFACSNRISQSRNSASTWFGEGLASEAVVVLAETSCVGSVGAAVRGSTEEGFERTGSSIVGDLRLASASVAIVTADDRCGERLGSQSVRMTINAAPASAASRREFLIFMRRVPSTIVLGR